MRIRNTFIIFLVSGFWHGANWTFIVWGFLNALFILPSIIFKTNRNNIEIVAKGRLLPSIKEFFSIVITFGLTVFAWIFFRATSISHAINYISTIFSRSLFTIPHFPGIHKTVLAFFLIGAFMIFEWLGREQQYAIAAIGINWKRPYRWSFYFILLSVIYFFGNFSETIEFIYFQF